MFQIKKIINNNKSSSSKLKSKKLNNNVDEELLNVNNDSEIITVRQPTRTLPQRTTRKKIKYHDGDSDFEQDEYNQEMEVEEEDFKKAIKASLSLVS